MSAPPTLPPPAPAHSTSTENAASAPSARPGEVAVLVRREQRLARLRRAERALASRTGRARRAVAVLRRVAIDWRFDAADDSSDGLARRAASRCVAARVHLSVDARARRLDEARSRPALPDAASIGTCQSGTGRDEVRRRARQTRRAAPVRTGRGSAEHLPERRVPGGVRSRVGWERVTAPTATDPARPRSRGHCQRPRHRHPRRRARARPPRRRARRLRRRRLRRLRRARRARLRTEARPAPAHARARHRPGRIRPRPRAGREPRRPAARGVDLGRARGPRLLPPPRRGDPRGLPGVRVALEAQGRALGARRRDPVRARDRAARRLARGEADPGDAPTAS